MTALRHTPERLIDLADGLRETGPGRRALLRAALHIIESSSDLDRDERTAAGMLGEAVDDLEIGIDPLHMLVQVHDVADGVAMTAVELFVDRPRGLGDVDA